MAASLPCPRSPVGARTGSIRSGAALLAFVIVGAGGCFSPPEACHDCRLNLIGGSKGSGGELTGSGGELGTGGTGAGGRGGSGGGVGSGGALGSGGRVATGGAVGSGGRVATGGTVGSGGMLASGGAVGSGGMVASGGAVGSGGMVASGGAAGGMVGSGGAAGGAPGTGGAAIDPDLVLWYKFDEASGTTAADAAAFGGTARNGTIAVAGTGTAAFSTTHQVGTHALLLTPGSSSPNMNGAAVTLPSLQTLAPTAITIASWINITTNTAAQNWERVFDFGVPATTPSVYMFLTARTNDSVSSARFAITTTGGAPTAEQRLSGTAVLATGWHHLAVVLPAGATYTGTLYIDGVAVATNNAMTLHATDLGATTGNYIGRSLYAADSYFNGSIDDFRVYKRALTLAEITALFAGR